MALLSNGAQPRLTGTKLFSGLMRHLAKKLCVSGLAVSTIFCSERIFEWRKIDRYDEVNLLLEYNSKDGPAGKVRELPQINTHEKQTANLIQDRPARLLFNCSERVSEAIQ